jgi:hypothetical protein
VRCCMIDSALDLDRKRWRLSDRDGLSHNQMRASVERKNRARVMMVWVVEGVGVPDLMSQCKDSVRRVSVWDTKVQYTGPWLRAWPWWHLLWCLIL